MGTARAGTDWNMTQDNMERATCHGWAWAALGVSLSVTSSSALAAELSAYSKLPTYEDVTLSPDGTRAAFITTVGEQRNVVVQSFVSSKEVHRIAAGDQKLRRITWAGSDRLLLLAENRISAPGFQRPFDMSTIHSYDLGQRKTEAPLMWIPGSQNIALGMPIVRAGADKPIVYIPSVPFGGSDPMVLYDIDFGRRSGRIALSSPADYAEWLVNGAGAIVGESGYKQSNQRWSLRLKLGERWTEVQSGTYSLDFPDVVGFAPEDGWAVVRRVPEDNDSLQLISLQDGQWGKVLEEARRADRYILDMSTHKLIGGVRLANERHYFFFDAAEQAAWNQVERAFPRESIELVSSSDDRKRLVVRVFGEKSGAVYALADLATNQLNVLGNYYAGIEPADIAGVKTIRYPAVDGLQINAYLTVPRGVTPKNMPLIVLPHGGPQARDVPGFDWWAQALASRGYAVLQPNFRGSSGFGKDFLAAGYGEIGRKMQTDLSDGVRYLSDHGIVDPKRVCIVGGSYGGYAALAGVALQQGIYRCAVSVAGPSDLRAQIESTGSMAQNYSQRYWARYYGVTDASDPLLDSLSPAKHADAINVPVLLIHGKEDRIVSFRQSYDMASALKRARKPVEFVELTGEDHWLSRAMTRAQMLEATVTFLEKNNPPR